MDNKIKVLKSLLTEEEVERIDRCVQAIGIAIYKSESAEKLVDEIDLKITKLVIGIKIDLNVTNSLTGLKAAYEDFKKDAK